MRVKRNEMFVLLMLRSDSTTIGKVGKEREKSGKRRKKWNEVIWKIK